MNLSAKRKGQWCRPSGLCQWNTFELVANVRGKVRTAAASACTSGESHGGGDGGRNWPGESSSIGVQFAAATLPGFTPFHLHGPLGMVPVHGASEPSAFAFAMTCSATRAPRSRPASKSLGYWRPARTRDMPASSAMLLKVCASEGRKCASTAAAACAVAACSNGYEGLVPYAQQRGQRAHQLVELGRAGELVEDRGQRVGKLLLPSALDRADVRRQPDALRQLAESRSGHGLPNSLPRREAGQKPPALVLPQRQPALPREQVMESVLERVTFGELAAHPARAGPVCDDGRHAAHVPDGVAVGASAKLTEPRQQLQQRLLTEVVGLGPLRRPVFAEVELVADDAFDDRLRVCVDELCEDFVGALVAGRLQEGFEQRVYFVLRLFHPSAGSSLHARSLFAYKFRSSDAAEK